MTEKSEMAMESILLVDDNPVNLRILHETLRDAGHALLAATNGDKAITIAGQALPGLILLDIVMDGIDGFEVCRRLKADPRTRDIPVIFLSALDETPDKIKGFQAGAVDYIPKPFQPEEVRARVNTHLTIHRLQRELQLQKNQLERELDIVSNVQRNLLPPRLPAVNDLRLAVHYETSRYAGGDYYDFAEIDAHRIGILVADAEGHSTPAAVRMAMTCALFRSYPEVPVAPDRVLQYLNCHLCKVADPSFITALFCVLDLQQRTLTIARAGHPLPMLFRRRSHRAVPLQCGGVYPLGLQDYEYVPVTRFRLEPGDRFFFYTDGITERFNADNEAYGQSRLLQQLENDRAGSPAALLQGVLDDMARFAGSRTHEDDQTLLVGFVS